MPLGIRVFNGKINGTNSSSDNVGSTQQRTDRCAKACFDKKIALDYGGSYYGPWSSRGDAVGFALVETSGRCYCQHEEFASCKKEYLMYTAYTFVGTCFSSLRILFTFLLSHAQPSVGAARQCYLMHTSNLGYQHP